MVKAFTFPLESNLNIDKNRSTVSVGGFWKIDAPGDSNTILSTRAMVVKQKNTPLGMFSLRVSLRGSVPNTPFPEIRGKHSAKGL
jgi:hypothetical protein